MNQEKRNYAEKHYNEHIREAGEHVIEQALAELLTAKFAYEEAEREPDPIKRYYHKNASAARYVEMWDRIVELGYTPTWDKETNRYYAVEAGR